MIITVSTAGLSHSTDPTAAALTAGFRSAALQAPRSDPDELPVRLGAAGRHRLYPNLAVAATSPGPVRGLRVALASLIVCAALALAFVATVLTAPPTIA